MFHYDRGLKLTRADLGLDVRRRQQRGFISHAHADHMASHVLALCTPATGALYRLRYGPREVLPLEYRATTSWGGMQLTVYPAGHCLGSAMLLADDGQTRLLYTGDFKLQPSLTAEAAELPQADVLVMESTYGDPRYRHPPRDEAIGQLLSLVRGAFEHGTTPVVLAYALGKAQEVTAILTQAGIPVLQHPRAFAISRIYQEYGVDLGNVAEYPGHIRPGHAVVMPPWGPKTAAMPRLGRVTTIAVTGWAAYGMPWNRNQAQHAVPLSDHADYEELLAAARQVRPRVIYATHGPLSFVERLRAEGFEAYPLDTTSQRAANNC
ncbi:MAG: MBL fold metallo-hydrolase [Pirellulales bacterium]|nr:MBL fold metallo-hydrolase [Pirellulales bacterium]